MQWDPTFLPFVYELFVVVVYCITYVAFYNLQMFRDLRVNDYE